MFTYCFIDKYGLSTPAEMGFDKDMKYLKSKVDGINFIELKILSRIF